MISTRYNAAETDHNICISQYQKHAEKAALQLLISLVAVAASLGVEEAYCPSVEEGHPGVEAACPRVGVEEGHPGVEVAYPRVGVEEGHPGVEEACPQVVVGACRNSAAAEVG